MEFNLTIDRGNSTIKLAAWTADCRCVDTERGDGICRVDMLAAKLAARVLKDSDSFKAAAYCTVVPSWRQADLDDIVRLCPTVINLGATTPLPFSISYSTPTSLGADRIAAVAGAIALRSSGSPLLVADLGTAATYDFVDATDTYLGGNIAPGIDMRLEALHNYTALLPQVSPQGEAPLWGSSTVTALRSGALRGVVAELEYYVGLAPETCEVFLTGGSVPVLIDAGLITFKHTYDPLLVHRGLNSIIHYNETN